MTDELDFERNEERLARRADDVATTPGGTDTASGQVGVGAAPGRPPATGTGERSHRTSAPPTGRLDDERAVWGASDAIPGSVAEGAPPANEGGALADRPADAVADFPADDVAQAPGIDEPAQRRSAGRSNLPPG